MRRKNRRGSTIAETGPSLLIFFIFVAFPLIDMIGLAGQYCAAWYLNHLQMRALIVNNKVQGPIMCDATRDAFLRSGPGTFMRSAAIGRTGPTYSAPPDLPGTATVRLITNVTVRPFLQIPFMGSIPGIGAPVTFSFDETRSREVLN